MFRSRPPGSASAKASSLSRLRATSPTTAPRDAYWRAKAAPMPVDAPVMKTLSTGNLRVGNADMQKLPKHKACGRLRHKGLVTCAERELVQSSSRCRQVCLHEYQPDVGQSHRYRLRQSSAYCQFGKHSKAGELDESYSSR